MTLRRGFLRLRGLMAAAFCAEWTASLAGSPKNLWGMSGNEPNHRLVASEQKADTSWSRVKARCASRTQNHAGSFSRSARHYAASLE
jgi:hypothetical protein